MLKYYYFILQKLNRGRGQNDKNNFYFIFRRLKMDDIPIPKKVIATEPKDRKKKFYLTE